MNLRFKKPGWFGGPNTTVRLGDKWLAYYNNERHDDKDPRLIDKGPVLVDLTDENDNVIDKGHIEAVLYTRFFAVPQTLLDIQHDLTCTDLRGLYDAMKKVYGERFDASSYVSIVIFSSQDGKANPYGKPSFSGDN